MTGSSLFGGAMALSAVACLVLIGVAFTELDYAADHPFAYGPAKVIATGAIAGALLALAVFLLALGMLRRR